jgi:hypothetical protein
MLQPTVSRLVCLGVKHPRTDFYYCQIVADLLMWGTLFDRRMGPSFTIAAGVASTVILGSESCGTHDHILLSQIQFFPILEG